MAWLLQPSLVRRVALTLLVAFLAVFVALLAQAFYNFRSPGAHEAQMRPLVQAICLALEAAARQDATTILRANERQLNSMRQAGFREQALAYPGDVLFVLQALDGRVTYATPPVPGMPLPANPDRPATVLLQGQAYWSVSHQSSSWRLTLLEPVVGDVAALQIYGGALVLPLLIALPIVMLPLWLAVHRGLSPLRALAARVSARQLDDFSPVGLEMEHRELKPLVRAFDESFRRSRQGIARERAIVQDAAHELRTPLAVIGAQAHNLVAASTDTDRQQARRALDHAIQRAAHLVHQLLTLARLEGSAAEAVQSVDLAEVARQVLIAATPRAEARAIAVQLESPDVLRATLDLSAFHSVLENLLGNALAYGRRHGRVLITLQAEAGQCRLVVADDGPGIAEPDRPLLFERFYRGREVDTPGSGLGLAIVDQAVRRMAGGIEIGAGLDGRGVSFIATFAISA